MSKILYGPVLVDSRGSIGGTVFTSGRFGPVARARKTPRNTRSAEKSLILSRTSYLSQLWGTLLSDSDRAAWTALALANPQPDVFGNDYALTGAQLYVQLNQHRLSAGLTRIDTAPLSLTTTTLLTLSIAATAPATLDLTFTAAPISSNESLYLFATPALSPGRGNFSNALAFIGISSASQTSPFSAGSLYTSRFGALRSGTLVAVRAHVLTRDSGALGPSIEASATVT